MTSAALWVLLATVVLVAAAGVTWRLRRGRIRARHAEPLPPAALAELPDLGADAVTLLQLSTAFCAPCRQARVVLGNVAQREPGVRHVEVDLTDRPELAGALRVRSTPTTLAVDSEGRELLRLVGVPDAGDLITALRPHLARR
jgi:thiol-disulfide isomerase/thioredoxin